MESVKEELNKRIRQSIWFPIIFVTILWFVKGLEWMSDTSFSYLGLSPLELQGLRGIVFAPLLHGSLQHLINNSIPAFVLTWTLFFFYREIAYKVFFLIYFIHEFWLWFLARESLHIGASGLVYGLASFLFVSGIVRKNSHLLAISLMVIFLYGSMVWGIFPVEENISWESHLTGTLCGIILAIYYKNYGPAPNISRWMDVPEEIDEDLDEDEDEDEYWITNDGDEKSD